MTHDDSFADLGAAVESAIERTTLQIESLQHTVDAIVEAAELTSTDDEHDPEGATIAYERAQAIALLRQARQDLTDLHTARERIAAGSIDCDVCGRPIPVERLTALPTTRRCVRCAS